MGFGIHHTRWEWNKGGRGGPGRRIRRMGRYRIHHFHVWGRGAETSYRRGRFAPFRNHRTHRRDRRRKRDPQRIHCCASGRTMVRRDMSGSRMPHCDSLSVWSCRGRRGSRVHRQSGTRGNTGYGSRRRSSRVLDTNKSSTCDEPRDVSVPCSCAEGVSACICRVGIDPGAHRAHPVALRRGPSRGYHRRRNRRWRFRFPTDFFRYRVW